MTRVCPWDHLTPNLGILWMESTILMDRCARSWHVEEDMPKGSWNLMNTQRTMIFFLFMTWCQTVARLNRHRILCGKVCSANFESLYRLRSWTAIFCPICRAPLLVAVSTSSKKRVHTCPSCSIASNKEERPTEPTLYTRGSGKVN